MKSGIYIIRNTVNEKIYVGSSVSIKLRWRQHKGDLRWGKHHNAHLQSAWKKYGEASFEFRVVEAVEETAKLRVREQHWIDTLNACSKGYNIAAIAGAAATREKRDMLADSSRGRIFSPETRAKLSAANKGKILSPEALEKLTASRRGKPLSAEHRAKLVEANKNISPETRAKLSAAGKGRPHTPEHRAKLSAAHMGKKRTPEVQARMTATRLRKAAEKRASSQDASPEFNDEPCEAR